MKIQILSLELCSRSLGRDNLLGCRPASSLMESDIGLWSENSVIYENVKQCRRLIGNLSILQLPYLRFLLVLVYRVSSFIN